MYNENILIYRRLKAIKRLVLLIFSLALIGSISCFVYSEFKYGSVSMVIKGRERKTEFRADKKNISDGNESMSSMNSDGDSGKNEIPDASEEKPKDKLPSDKKDKKDKTKPKSENKSKDKKKGKADFSKALFIGNSITEGFSRWGDMKEATFYAVEGLNVNSFFNTDKFRWHNKQITPDAALAEGNFDKVFLMFGINELGWRSKEAFINRYKAVIESVKEKQPNAEIYVQSIIYVTAKKSKSDKIFNNKKIEEFNAQIEKMSKENQVKYIDLNKGLCGDKKYLPKDAATDGIHLSPSYCKKWKAYLVEYFNN